MIKGLLISYIYLLGMVVLGELIRKHWHLASEFTRKFIHVGVGFWGIIAYYTLDQAWLAAIPPASFVLINAVSYRWTLLKSMEISDRRNLGTIYYPLSLTILIILYWESNPTAVLLGLLIMALGDGFAAILGRYRGRRFYVIWGVKRSIEGSAAMLVFAFTGALIAFFVAGGDPLNTKILPSLLIACAAALIEGMSPRGLDNLTVPLAIGIGYAML